ncbi:MAG TPA: ABC transporter permease [Candidatus Acidoferrales bacterium]|nr:ABC transporter permease [Candidatus Acidoferrales bacterium]
MRSLYAIYRKEMGHYFVSPIAYIFIGLFLILTAFFFNVILAEVIKQSFQMEMQGMRFAGPSDFDVPGAVMRSFFGLLSTLVLFFTPILTMGVYAEERKRGTMELLMTSPVSELEIVLGKYLASLSLFALMLLPTASYMIFMVLRSDPRPPWSMVAAGYAGVLLLGGSLLALGSFVSSLTENQLIAAVVTFAASLFIWVLDIGRNSDSGAGAVLQYLSVIRHYEDFTRGVIDTSSLIYYGSFIALFVFLTVRSVDSMRWRRA